MWKNFPCVWSSQPLIPDVTQSMYPPLPHPWGACLCPSVPSSSQTAEVKTGSHASPRALQMMHEPARVGGALPVVPCPLCCNAGCVHLPMLCILVLRCSRIISWPISKHFVYPSRHSCARELEGIHQHWSAVLHLGIGWYPYSFPHMYWLDMV